MFVDFKFYCINRSLHYMRRYFSRRINEVESHQAKIVADKYNQAASSAVLLDPLDVV